jgi:[acyl-carrier-protein] S-malonyltransferase
LMQEFGHGAMAAVLGMETAAVQALAAEAGVEVANINAPGQVTIAGRQEDVERAAALAKERGARRAIMLPVSAAFHTSLMRPVADALTPFLDAAHLTDPVVPIMANVDGQPLATAADLRAELINHIFSPVQWVRAVETMRDAGITDYHEIGPGAILSGLIKRIQKDARTQTSDALLAV